MMTTVLLLEDNRDMLNLTADFLEIAGYQVLRCLNGVEGLARLQEQAHIPDIIVTDVAMPVMDGIAFVETVRDHAVWKQIPVVIVSGDAQDETFQAQHALEGFLLKPFRQQQLEALIRRLTRDPAG